jgi:Fur family ferric uptake transcriptional regulator
VSAPTHDGHPATLRREWVDHAIHEISAAGHRSGAARRRVIEALAAHDCCLSAQELHDELQSRGRPVGIASVYRVIELLLSLRLVQRFDFDGGTSRYEPALPGGEHHHHLLCVTCGEVRPFDDPHLESAIHSTATGADWAIDDHDVVLRGRCPTCRATT